MRKSNVLVLFLTVGLLVGLSSWSLAQGEKSDPGAQQSPVTQQQQDVKTFTGKIAKSEEGKFVLQDTTAGTTYQLDDQAKAKRYDGKNVRVKGTLDTASNTIHMSSIEPA